MSEDGQDRLTSGRAKTSEELADEAAECIEVHELRGDALAEYLRTFFADISARNAERDKALVHEGIARGYFGRDGARMANSSELTALQSDEGIELCIGHVSRRLAAMP